MKNAENMFRVETKILSLTPKGIGGRCTACNATRRDTCGGGSEDCCMSIVFVHFLVVRLYKLCGKCINKFH